MTTDTTVDVELDVEWAQLILEGFKIGLTKEDILTFLQSNTKR